MNQREDEHHLVTFEMDTFSLIYELNYSNNWILLNFFRSSARSQIKTKTIKTLFSLSTAYCKLHMTIYLTN